MTDRLNRRSRITLAVLLLAGSLLALQAQAARDEAQLGQQLRERYDIVALKDGVGLVPHERRTDIRLIEVRDGAITINGEPVTGREAQTRLGRDADLVLRITYLDQAAQRELAGASPSAASQAGDGAAPADSDREPERTQIRRGDLVRIGDSVKVSRDERVDGDVVAVGGSADIDGEVTGDVSVVGGSLNLGPAAIVRGDVAVIGGALSRAPGARIYGKVDDVGFGAHGRWREWHGFPFWTAFWRVGGLIGTLLRITLLMLGALLVVALGGRFVEAIADRTASEPVRSGLAGLLAEVLFVPLLVITIVVLAVSIVGIPLLLLVPFAIVLALVLMLVGFTGVAHQVGRILTRRLGGSRGTYGTVALGVLAIVGLTLIARVVGVAGGLVFGGLVGGPLAAVGYLVEYVAWTIGAGAVVLTWLSMRHRPPAPMVTPHAAAPEAHAE